MQMLDEVVTFPWVRSRERFRNVGPGFSDCYQVRNVPRTLRQH